MKAGLNKPAQQKYCLLYSVRGGRFGSNFLIICCYEYSYHKEEQSLSVQFSLFFQFEIN